MDDFLKGFISDLLDTDNDTLLNMLCNKEFYSDEEYELIINESVGRGMDVEEILNAYNDELSEAEAKLQKAKNKIIREKKKQQENEERERQIAARKEEEKRSRLINELPKYGLNGYFEYKVLSLVDKNGVLNAKQLELSLNSLGMEGWRMVSSFTNELGYFAASGDTDGASAGTSSASDQSVIILERFVLI